MSRYIDADNLIKKMQERYNDLLNDDGYYDHFTQGYEDALSTVENEPTADVQEVRHGKWRDVMPPRFYACSYCGGAGHGIYKFCPWCGAKMDLEE